MSIFSLCTVDSNSSIVPVNAIELITALTGNTMLQFIQKYIHPNEKKFKIVATTSETLILQINDITQWVIKSIQETVFIEIKIDTTKISTDCGTHAIMNPSPAHLVYPDTISHEFANHLTSMRKSVFMGVGPKREYELLVTGDMYILIKPEQWDLVSQKNKQFAIPSYYDILQMGEITPIYETSIIGDGNLMSDHLYGSKSMEPQKCTVAFVSGIRLERVNHTDYLQVHSIGEDGSFIFNKPVYSQILCNRIAPIFSYKRDCKFWIPLFGLGIYAEAIHDSHKIDLFTAWIDGICAAALITKIKMNQVYLPFWAQFACKPLYDNWVSRGFPIARHAHEFAQEYKESSVIFVCGDPVALPGNELAIGMFKESGDPFSMSYLTYLPSVASTPEDVLKCKMTPYHEHCKMLLSAHQSIFGTSTVSKDHSLSDCTSSM